MSPLLRRKIVAVLLLVIFLFETILGGETTANCTSKKSIVVDDVGFSTPESVEYYADEDVYFVTNINGSPIATDDNGFISKVKPDGSIIDLKWVDGSNKNVTLNAPKGAAIQNNKLYVADLNQIHIFELPTGRQKKSITIKGSTFLNGITPGAGNIIYVTNTGFGDGSDAVYKVWENGKYKAIVKGKDLGRFNGVLEDGNKVMVVTFGSGKIISIDSTGNQTVMSIPPKGSLDGLLKMQDGRFLISSWGGSAIYILNQDKTFNILTNSLDSPADLGFDTKRDRVLIPLFKQNKVVILPL